MDPLPLFFSDQILFDSVSSYLDIADLMRISQVNTYLKLIIEEKCKAIIKSHNLSLIPSKTAIHQMRFYFDRCLTLYKKKDEAEQIKAQKIGKEKQRSKQQKHSNSSNQNDKLSYSLVLTLENPIKFRTITYLEVGVQYTVCLTIDKEAYIFKTCSLTSLKNKNSVLNYQKRTNVAQIKCKSEHVTYLTQSGQIFQIFGQKNCEKIFQKEEKLQWCQDIRVEQIEASFNYTIFKLKRSDILYEQFLKYIFHYQIDLQKVKKNLTSSHQKSQFQSEGSKTTLVLLNNISFKYYLIEFAKEQKIEQIAVGNRQAYFLNDNYQCFVSYFQQDLGNLQNIQIQHPNNKIIKAKKFQHFIEKPIIKLASGYNFFIALERKIHDVSKWTVEEVCKWVRQIGFGPFAKIFNVEKVDGKKLLTIDKNYMHSSLGITKSNMQQKFLMLLEEVTQNKNKQDTLYGWGKNENGQLGSRNANFIKQPQKIKLPTCFKQSEHIDSIFCGWFQTFIRTQKGRVYRTVNCQKKKKNVQNYKEEDEIDSKVNQKGSSYLNKHLNEGKKVNIDYEEAYDSQTDFEQKKNPNKNQKGYHSKKKKKNTQEIVKRDYNHKKFEEEQKWVQCQVGKAFFVQGYKDFLFFIQCPSQKQFEPAKQKKLRTIKTVLNKIIWSLGAQQQQTYKVGYMDKDMGMIQTTILQLKAFDYNENRIKYIKKGNNIVWDRQNKIDNL